VTLPRLHCFRCGNVWTPRKSRVKTCPLCKSALWDTPRAPEIPPFDPTNRSWTEVVRPNRERIVRLAKRHHATNVRVFGSVRRGTADATSDLDVLVTFGPAANLFDQIGLQQDLTEALGRRVDVVSDRSIFWFLRPQILAEAIPL
jgi:uncharacterized protein